MPRFYVEGLTASRSPETVLVEAENASKASEQAVTAGWLARASTARVAPNGRVKYIIGVQDGASAQRVVEVVADSLGGAVDQLKRQGLRPIALRRILELLPASAPTIGTPATAATGDPRHRNAIDPP